jgi:hypothetical protein
MTANWLTRLFANLEVIDGNRCKVDFRLVADARCFWPSFYVAAQAVIHPAPVRVTALILTAVILRVELIALLPSQGFASTFLLAVANR